jgi:hypothetical protein
MTNKETAVKYCNDILSDIIPPCLYIKQAFALFLDNLKRTDLYFDDYKVNRVTTFINQLNLSEQQTPKKFILQP